jgi:ABC-type antimicrobial peptide transport system permease subunit
MAQQLSPAVPVSFTTLDALTDQHMAAPRFRTLLIGLFAMVALTLAVLGVFGVMAYVVGQRTREIGLRVAVGASPGQVLRLLFRRGLAIVGAGLVIGLLGAAMSTRFLSNLLFAIEPIDPVTFAGVAVVLAVTSLVALYVPARRATRIDPLVALRCE